MGVDEAGLSTDKGDVGMGKDLLHTSAQLLMEKDIADQKAVGATRVIHTRP